MKAIALLLLRLYRVGVSSFLRPACRFQPTCSQYAIEAIETHGLMAGSRKALWRLLRCHPFAKSGYDPVQ